MCVCVFRYIFKYIHIHIAICFPGLHDSETECEGAGCVFPRLGFNVCVYVCTYSHIYIHIYSVYKYYKYVYIYIIL